MLLKCNDREPSYITTCHALSIEIVQFKRRTVTIYNPHVMSAQTFTRVEFCRDRLLGLFSILCGRLLPTLEPPLGARLSCPDGSIQSWKKTF